MECFIGTVVLVPYTYIPEGWLPCIGTLESISAYSPLYAAIGTTYGGNGNDTFAVPNLPTECQIAGHRGRRGRR